MQTYGASRSTTASPGRIWGLWCDPNNWSQWNSGIKAAQIAGTIADGAKGKMTTNRGTVHDVTFSNVVEGRGFSVSMAGPPMTTVTFTCEVTPEGAGSKIAQSVAFAGPLAFIFGPMMGKEMAKHFVPVLDDLARAAES
ncbi:MAG: SRPBCC family protein [Candidatus Baltobacteraceae bacterium]